MLSWATYDVIVKKKQRKRVHSRLMVTKRKIECVVCAVCSGGWLDESVPLGQEGESDDYGAPNARLARIVPHTIYIVTQT